jgi:predicted RNA-binding protein with PUA-like domain
MPNAKRHWLIKQEPSAFSWSDFVAAGHAQWDGVRNYQARNNLRAMRKGDLALFYHSVTGKEVVGVAKVVKEAYPDPTADSGDWSCVDFKPVKPLKRAVPLEAIKAEPKLAELPLIRHSRLSVMPVSAAEFEVLLQLGETKL